MIGRPLAILSEGRLSDSQIRALTLLSLGWLELTLSEREKEETRKRRRIGVIYTPWNPKERQRKKEEEDLVKRIREDDEEILAIIRTFIACQQ